MATSGDYIPITWKTVSGPSNASANALLSKSGEQLGAAIEGLGTNVGQYADDKQKRETDAFIAELNALGSDEERNDLLAKAETGWMNLDKINTSITDAQNQDFLVADEARAVSDEERTAEEYKYDVGRREFEEGVAKVDLDTKTESLKNIKADAAHRLLKNPIEINKLKNENLLSTEELTAKRMEIKQAEINNPVRAKKLKEELNLTIDRRNNENTKASNDAEFNALNIESIGIRIDNQVIAQENTKTDRARQDKLNILSDKRQEVEDAYKKATDPIRKQELLLRLRKVTQNEKDYGHQETAKIDKLRMRNSESAYRKKSLTGQISEFNKLEQSYLDQGFNTKNLEFLDRERNRLLSKADIDINGLINELTGSTLTQTYDPVTSEEIPLDISKIKNEEFTAQVKLDLKNGVLDQLESIFPNSSRTQLEPTAVRLLNKNVTQGIKFTAEETLTKMKLESDDIINKETVSILQKTSQTVKELHDNFELTTVNSILQELGTGPSKQTISAKNKTLLKKDLKTFMGTVESMFTGLDEMGKRNMRIAAFHMLQNVDFDNTFYTANSFDIDGVSIEQLKSMAILQNMRRFFGRDTRFGRTLDAKIKAKEKSQPNSDSNQTSEISPVNRNIDLQTAFKNLNIPSKKGEGANLDAQSVRLFRKLAEEKKAKEDKENLLRSNMALFK